MLKPSKPPPERKKAQARARSFTTLRTDPGVVRSASFEETTSPATAEPEQPLSLQPLQSPTAEPSSSEDEEMPEPELTQEELTACMPEDPSPIEFHALFHECHATKQRPARRLFPKSKKAFTVDEAQKYYESHKEEAVALCYDLSDYNQVAWNYKFDRWTTPTETDHFENTLEQLYDTKGAFMAEAVRDKELHEVSNPRISCVSCTMQGWRSSNEDAHAASLSLPNHPTTSYFGVYDGHGGWRVAEHTGRRLHLVVDSMLPASLSSDDAAERVQQAFLETDAEIVKEIPTDHSGSAGTTVNTILIQGETMLVANAGDSRAVMCRNGEPLRLSHDHKPDSPRESARIKNSGSLVSKDGRVEGMLAVSRALGDFDFKQAGGLPPSEQAVTAHPTVEKYQLSPADSFIIQACDGIWDVLSDEDAVRFVSTRLAQKMPLQQIATQLLDECISDTIEEEGIGTDNMTVNLVVLKS